jgi:hypothetical protein
MLPDGSLLAQRVQQPGGGWDLLEPAATSWCAVGGLASVTANFTTPFTAADGQLWWLAGGPGNSAPMTLHHVPLSALSCR